MNSQSFLTKSNCLRLELSQERFHSSGRMISTELLGSPKFWNKDKTGTGMVSYLHVQFPFLKGIKIISFLFWLCIGKLILKILVLSGSVLFTFSEWGKNKTKPDYSLSHRNTRRECNTGTRSYLHVNWQWENKTRLVKVESCKICHRSPFWDTFGF